MQVLLALHHLIPLDELNLMVPFLCLADNWLLSYPLLCTFVPWAGTDIYKMWFATVMQALQVLYHSTPLDEPILMVPFLSLADNWLLSSPPFPTS